jgi:Uma2 family endonuclease
MTTSPTIPNSALPATNLKSWTVQEYHRMSDSGILDSSERTELIAGQIVLMVAKGTPHVITNLLHQLGQNALIRTQDPIQLDDFSEPEPDLVLVKGNILDYINNHPQPADVYLVVEVADFTLKTDCEIKDKIYAQAGIADYWVIDIKNRQVHIFRDPTPSGYTSHLILSATQTISPLAFCTITLPITAILPPE